MNQLRVFVALELSPAITAQLGQAIADLKPRLPRDSIRWVKAEGIHLTVKFYGDVATERLPALEGILPSAAVSARSFSLTVGGLGVFPNPFSPRVMWVGMAGDLENLEALQKKIEDASTALDFAPEPRGFSPHLTLGRFSGALRPPDREKLTAALADSRFARLGSFTAEALTLFRSDLKPGGAIYTRLSTAALGSPNP